jgi:hypothetical protein
MIDIYIYVMLYKPRNIRKSQFLGSSDAVTANVTAELLTWCFLFFSWLYRSFFGGSMVTDIFGEVVAGSP